MEPVACSNCGETPYAMTYIPNEEPWKCTHSLYCRKCGKETQRYDTYYEAEEEWRKINEQ